MLQQILNFEQLLERSHMTHAPFHHYKSFQITSKSYQIFTPPLPPNQKKTKKIHTSHVKQPSHTMAMQLSIKFCIKNRSASLYQLVGTPCLGLGPKFNSDGCLPTIFSRKKERIASLGWKLESLRLVRQRLCCCPTKCTKSLLHAKI